MNDEREAVAVAYRTFCSASRLMPPRGDSHMSVSKLVTTAVVIAGVSVVAGTSKLALAQQSSNVLGDLTSGQAIFADGKTFKIATGKTTGDITAQLAALGAKEVTGGAIIVRSGDKLYIIEGKPPIPAPQAMKDFQDNWAVSFAKDFQDNWNVSFMKNFQDNWNVSFMKDMNNFQDNWNVSFMKDAKDKPNDAYMKGLKALEDNYKAAYLKDFQDRWNVSFMNGSKNFQDNWNVSFMKNFQDRWNVSYMTTLKDFQDNWASSYMK
jgi:hypothetical protein